MTEQQTTEPKEPTIHLDQFLKTCGVATGGQAKIMIQAGEILVNEEIETRRRRQLRAGDEVTLGDVVYVVTLA
jgi:ribosome-associated protein